MSRRSCFFVCIYIYVNIIDIHNMYGFGCERPPKARRGEHLAGPFGHLGQPCDPWVALARTRRTLSVHFEGKPAPKRKAEKGTEANISVLRSLPFGRFHRKTHTCTLNYPSTKGNRPCAVSDQSIKEERGMSCKGNTKASSVPLLQVVGSRLLLDPPRVVQSPESHR